jgi:hypothetical protein
VLDFEISSDEAARLRREARSHKCYRLEYFNSADGINLRLFVGEIDTKHSDIERHSPSVGTVVNLEAGGDTYIRFAAHVAMCIYLLDVIVGCKRTSGRNGILKDD